VVHDKFDEFKKADKMVLIAFVDKETEAPAEALKVTADAHRDDFLFGLSTDAEVIKAAGVKTPALVLYRSFDEPEVKFPSSVASATSDEIVNFLNDNKVPLLDEVGQENYAVYAQSGLPLAYLFVDQEDSNRDQLLADLKPIAKEHKGKINFVSIDAAKFADHGKALNLDPTKFPAFVIQDLEKQLKFPFSQEKALSMSAVADFANQYVAGKLEPVLKSEPIPETQDSPVYTLVGKTFDGIVFDDKKDVFIEFYAPWCVVKEK
jgi:protein disulfide-isomerase A1